MTSRPVRARTQHRSREADNKDMDDPQSTPPPRSRRRDRRRARQRVVYTAEQLLGRAPIWLRRRSDKLRLAGHVVVIVALVASTIWWVIPEHTFTGPVLVIFAPGRGVHLGDLPTLGFAVLAARSLRALRRLRSIS
ncbi:hypothetical protein BH23ACT10_BH23ACT10_22710 [soil metagenome]